jgi:CubicO group peptidase (beta-lactamase class C family)
MSEGVPTPLWRACAKVSRWMRRTALALLLACGCAGAPAVLGAPIPSIAPAQAGFSLARLQRLDRWVRRRIAAQREAGAVVLIARRGRIAYLKAYGEADLATRTPMRVNDYFRLYSMTKPVTAVALLTLYERGKFQLTDPLEKYIPAFAHVKVYDGFDADGGMILVAPKRPITIEDLLRHTAGFTYGYFGNTAIDKAYRAAGIDYRKLDSVKALTEDIAREPLLYQPGERWVYSFSYDVLAYLIERLSGMPFAEYCRKAIFEPLGMRHTVFGAPRRLAARFPVTYAPNSKGGIEPLPAARDFYPHFTHHPFGGASLSSTPRDYLRFAEMLLNGGELDGVRILSPATVALMTSDAIPRGTPSFAPGMGYGLGVSVLEDPTRNGALGWPGDYGWSGYATTRFTVDPHEHMIVMIFAQLLPMDGRFLDTVQTLAFQALVH